MRSDKNIKHKNKKLNDQLDNLRDFIIDVHNTQPIDQKICNQCNTQLNSGTSDQNTGIKGISSKRRKRINRYKVIIITLLLLLIILPTMVCIYLGYKVNLLQNQVNDLLTMHGREEIDYIIDIDESYAYAAERGPKDTEDVYIEQPDAQDDDKSNEQAQAEENANEQPDAQTDDESIEQSESQREEKDIEQAEEKTADSTEEKANDQGDTQEDKTHEQSEIQIQGQATTQSDQKSSPEDENKIYAGKQVYLTFDDGPSIYTEQILDTLAKYEVKATFFVTGKTDEESLKRYQRIVDEGHTLGIHSYSHVYKQIYNSVEDFDKDFTKLWKLLYDTTGYKPTIYRFPGGSANKVNKNGMTDFIQYLNDKSIVYFDWNVDSKDATGKKYTKKELINNVLQGVSLKKRSIVLMHDLETKKTTADSLPGLLKKLIEGGAELLPLDENVKPIQQIKYDSIK